jgi:hypothetical protein
MDYASALLFNFLLKAFFLCIYLYGNPRQGAWVIFYFESCKHRVQGKGRGETGGSVSALSAGAYTTTLFVMEDRVKDGGRAPPAITRLG